MQTHLRWLHRRLRRTRWLLRNPATRTSMIRFLFANTAGAAFIHGRGYIRSRWSMAGDR